MTNEKKEKPDAFKAVMAAAKFDFGRTDLPHQSLGRKLTAREEALADALMEIYAGRSSWTSCNCCWAYRARCAVPEFR